MIALPTIQNAGDVHGKRVLLRLDLNLPILEGRVSDTYRLDRVSKTLEFLKVNGARTLIVGHIESKETNSLRLVGEVLSKRFKTEFAMTLEEARIKLEEAQDGSFVLLENLRGWEGEKKNSSEFAQSLVSLADLYVNDAFSVSHREHASIVGVPTLLPSYVGFLFEEEVKNLSLAFSPARPALLILGGAKFETKIPLIEKFLPLLNDVYLCGALANDVYKARGYETGISLVSKMVPNRELLENPKLHTPSDVIARTDSGSGEKGSDSVRKDEKIVDAGSDAISDILALIEKARFILWNGPLGEYESGFDAGTIAVAEAIAESDAQSIIGGGDSLAVVSKLGLLPRFSFVSTGGGAMLDFLANETLPGIVALEKSVEV